MVIYTLLDQIKEADRVMSNFVEQHKRAIEADAAADLLAFTCGADTRLYGMFRRRAEYHRQRATTTARYFETAPTYLLETALNGVNS